MNETKALGNYDIKKPFPAPLFSPQISHGLRTSSDLRSERPANGPLGHGTAAPLVFFNSDSPHGPWTCSEQIHFIYP